MSWDEYVNWDLDPWEEYTDTYEYFEKEYSKREECKFCGKSGLEWVETMNGWRLYDTEEDKLHRCTKSKT